jgi:hypothetical protein
MRTRPDQSSRREYTTPRFRVCCSELFCTVKKQKAAENTMISKSVPRRTVSLSKNFLSFGSLNTEKTCGIEDKTSLQTNSPTTNCNFHVTKLAIESCIETLTFHIVSTAVSSDFFNLHASSDKGFCGRVSLNGGL